MTVTLPPPPPVIYNLNITVSPQDGGKVTPSSGTYSSGAQIALQATPAGPGWVFERWSGDASGTVTSVSLTMNGNKGVTAHFVRVKHTLSVTVSPAGSGTVGPAGGTYNYGEPVTLTAAPAAGFEFDRWGGDASGTSPSTNIMMQSDKNVTAFFKTLHQTIKRDMPPGSMALNTFAYMNTLKTGQRLQGFIELAGDFQAGDSVASWNFAVTGPQGIVIENWYGSVQTSRRYDFDKTLQFDGIYTIKVTHNSRWAKTVTIQVVPGGWQ
ncbi:MAG: InlB B-repeat-containing protein [Chloroflexi bacterium]|nr:InlB B-repeat-containing protein [Chloroflexota bacterium]